MSAHLAFVGPPPEFIAVALVSAAFAIFFRRSRNAALKRRVRPYWLVTVAVLFLGLVWRMSGRTIAAELALPVIAILALTSRGTRYCDACGSTARTSRFWHPPKYCPECGHSLGIRTGISA